MRLKNAKFRPHVSFPSRLACGYSVISEPACLRQAAQVCLVAHRGSILLTQNRQGLASLLRKQLKFVLSPNGAPFCCAKPPNLAPICHPEWSDSGTEVLRGAAQANEQNQGSGQSRDRRDLLRMTNSFPDRCYIHYATQRK